MLYKKKTEVTLFLKGVCTKNTMRFKPCKIPNEYKKPREKIIDLKS